MKLKKLYANSPKFKSIHFNPDFNVVFGDVIDDPTEEPGTVQEHNLGKTSLVELIDFMLLKEVGDESYLVKFNHKFLNWIFFLEIELNDGSYVTVRRSPDTPTKIAFKGHQHSDQDFVDEEEWDYEDLGISSRKPESNPKRIFHEEYLKFDVQIQYSYRTFLCYLLRTQFDYVDVFKLNQFEGGDSNWKPALFSVLGFDERPLTEKYQLEQDLKHIKKAAKALDNSDSEDGEKYKIRAAIEAKQDERDQAQKNVDAFNFYTEDNHSNRELVQDIEKEVSLLNDQKYAVTYDLDQIKTSLENEQLPELSGSDLASFFKEIRVSFPDSLKTQYEDVVRFSRQLSQERRKYLLDEQKSLQKNLRNLNKKLIELNDRRVNLLKGIREDDSFKKYKIYQAKVATIDKEIFDYSQKLRDIERLESFKEELSGRELKIDGLKNKLSEELDDEPEVYRTIQKLFREYYKQVFEYTATLVVKLNKPGNILFEPMVVGAGNNMTGKSKGYTSTRVMCTSFVLAVLAAYSDKSYFRFVYHDGIMEGWGDSHKVSFIDLIRDYTQEYGVQYITSVIRSDVPEGFEFKKGEVVRTLTKQDTLFNVDF